MLHGHYLKELQYYMEEKRIIRMLCLKAMICSVSKSKKELDGVLLQITQTSNWQGIPLSKVIESCNVTEGQSYEAVKNVKKVICFLAL